MKKFNAVLMAMLFGMCGQVLADDTKYGNQVAFVVLDESAKTAKLTGCWYRGNLNLPTTVVANEETTEYTVTQIGDYVMKGDGYNTEVTGVTIPSTVTTIASNAFNGCSALTDVYMSGAAVTVSSTDDCHLDWAFYGLSGLTLHFNTDVTGNYRGKLGTVFSTVSIDKGCTTINSSVLADNTSITKVVINSTLTKLGSWQFYGCSGLTTVEFGDNAGAPETIESDIFNGLTNSNITLKANQYYFKAIKDKFGDQVSGMNFVVPLLTLNSTWNNSHINDVTAEAVDVTNTFHTGYWNTLVIPFAMTADEIAAKFGTGTKIVELSGYTSETVSFSSVSTITANKPCMVRPTAGSDITSMSFGSKTITASTDPSDSYFKGTYNGSSNTMPANTYYIKQDKVYKSNNTSLQAMHGYFDFSGASLAPARSFSIVIDGETTGIESIYGAAGSIENTSYNLAGQRLAHPQKGINIVNGKKVIIK